MSEPSRDTTGRFEAIANGTAGVVDANKVKRELDREADRLLRADRPEPDFQTPVAAEMWRPNPDDPQLVVAEPARAQTETQTPEPSSLPESSAPRQGFSFRRMLAALRGK
jgi:hypothetical protein